MNPATNDSLARAIDPERQAHPSVIALHNEASALAISGNHEGGEALHDKAQALQDAIDTLGAVEVAPKSEPFVELVSSETAYGQTIGYPFYLKVF